MSVIAKELEIASPASLFLEMWERALTSMNAHQRMTASQPDHKFKETVLLALSKDSGQDAYDELVSLLNVSGNLRLASERNGCVLYVMGAIDDLFYEVHPRAQVAAQFRRGERLPAWIKGLRDLRFISGAYVRNERYSLIPRGPLLRSARNENASNAENFLDRFAALCRVPRTLALNDRPILVQQVVIGVDAARGVPSTGISGTEEVVFFPIAERPGDIEMTQRSVAAAEFVDFKLREGLNPAQLLLDSIMLAGKIDIGFAPEFVMPGEQAAILSKGLRSVGKDSPRLLVAGSGQSVEVSVDGLKWNESFVFNQRGHNLWRQRKLWPAGLTAARAAQYGLRGKADRLVMEDSADGDTIVVADIDGLGRCVTLICQDVEGRPLADDLIRHFQPDWVFVPILDPGVVTGRWAHQRTFGLSALSNARFLVASSTALSDNEDPSCGLAIGPKAASEADGDDERVFLELKAPIGDLPAFIKIKWRSGGWQRTNLGAAV